MLPPLAMITAMKDLEDEGDLQNARFVHLSSMGALMLEHDPYGLTKKEAEDEILKVKFKNVCVLRVGYAFQSAEEGEVNKIDNIHAYSPEQLAALWVQPLLGSGTQLLQPVFTGDIVEAGLNFKEGVLVVNAIGREIISQENFVGYFCRLADKKFIPIHVPLGLAQFAATLFPKGHFSPYAIEGCRLLEEKEMLYDASEFEKLVGHQTSSLEDVYGSLRGKVIYYPMPPIKEHFNEAVSKIPQIIVTGIFQVARATILNSDATRRAILNYQQDF